jgi:putative intracellular protease/amidase
MQPPWPCADEPASHATGARELARGHRCIERARGLEEVGALADADLAAFASVKPTTTASWLAGFMQPRCEEATMKILMVLTSHDTLGNTGRKTGFWLEEFAAPYYVFLDAGAEVTLASPKGGQPPIDPKSDEPENQTPAQERFKADPKAQKVLANTRRLETVSADDYDAVFYPGGHGPMWDLVDDPISIRLIERFYNSGKPVATVCHAPAVLHRVQYKGEPIVKGKRVTGFTSSEEAAVGLTDVVPFLVEDELVRLGGKFEKVDDWQVLAITDGRLITGQNPASSETAAKKLLELLATMRPLPTEVQRAAHAPAPR